jgi:hypothetical protein
MILYHGSTVIVKNPKIIVPQRHLDFGKGFYCTTERSQAESWARIKQKREANKTSAIVSVYSIDDAIFLDKNIMIKIFESATEEWLDFIIANRNGHSTFNFDIVKGPVANDTLYASLALYETGILTKEETIKRLKTHKLFDQISFSNEKIIERLKFENSYALQ